MFATEVTAIIEGAVCQKQSNLTEIKQIIFQNLKSDELPHAADLKLIENCFIKILIDCARIEFENKFHQLCNEEEFVRKFTKFSDQIYTISDLIGLCKADVYATQLELHSNLMDELDLISFITNMKAHIWRSILEKSKTGHIELQVLQGLVACFQADIIPQSMYDVLVKFKRDCGSQSRSASYLKKLMNKIELEKNSAWELRLLLRSIKSLTSEHLCLENQLLQLIGFYLNPAEIAIKTIGSRSIIEVIGGTIYMSQQLQEIEKELSKIQLNQPIDEYRFIAVHRFEINCDLDNTHWHGMNIFVMATAVTVSKKCKWNLSGLSSFECLEKAKNGTKNTKNGADGVDGCCGESSGNVMIIADQMQHPEWLTVILNGGNGAKGQDGGNGMNGENGEGISISELERRFPSPVHFWGGFYDLSELFNNICSTGMPQVKWNNNTCGYVELKLDTGQEIIHSASRYVAGNCYTLYKGSLGQAGGHGGLNGLGGEGGYQGECNIRSKQNQLFPVTITSTKGNNGQDGNPGQNGEYGKNGNDVGYIDFQNWSTSYKFGENQNQRLRMDYSTDSSDRVYCGYQYDKRGSPMCYATMKASPLQHHQLTENEKSREKCTNRQREQRAVATRKTAMQDSVMTQSYDQHFENGDRFLDGIVQMNADATINFDMMQRKAKTAFEQVNQLKERSREKVSRYQIYEANYEVRKRIADMTTKTEVCVKQWKSQILADIKNSTCIDDSIWKKLFQEEFREDELDSIEAKFNTSVINRKIQTLEMQQMQKKIGLAKFQHISSNDCLVATDSEINLNIDKYLKINEESKPNLQLICQYFEENERIQDDFDELLKYRISTANFHAIQKYYDEFILIEIATQNLPEFLENVDETDEQQLSTASEKLSELNFNSDKLKNSLQINVEQTEKLKNLIPNLWKQVPTNNKNLFLYVLNLYKQLRTIIIANCTLANLIELFINEHQQFESNSDRIQQCLEFQKNFLAKKQASIEKIHQTVKFLSCRSTKVNWLHFHECPNFLATNHIQQEMNIHKKLLQKLYELYLIKQNERMNWHEQIDNELLEMCLNKMKSDQLNISVSLFELVAWKHQLNIKIYSHQSDSKQQFVSIREHHDHNKQIFRILIQEDKTIKHLEIDQEFIELAKIRKYLISKFQSDRKNKQYFPFDDVEYLSYDHDVIISKLGQFFPEDDRNQIEDRLNKLSARFIGKNSILSSLLYCFMCNGCHINLHEIIILVNTILECSIDFDQDPELFSYLILAYSQFQLIDELILINFENLTRKSCKNKCNQRQYLKNISNRSVKSILAMKLEESNLNINEDFFSNILLLLSYIKEDSIFLEQLKLSEWSLALKKSYWQHGLTKGQLNFHDESLEQCSFYLVKLEDMYNRELVQTLVNILNEAKFFSIETLLTFVHRFYADDTELCSDILDDFGILNSTLSDILNDSKEKYSGDQLLTICQQNKNCSKKQVEHLQCLMTKLGLLASDDRQMEDLIQIIQKSFHQNEIDKHLSIIDELFKRMDNSPNPILRYAVDGYNNQHAAQDQGDFRPEPLVYDKCCNNEQDFKKIIEYIRLNIELVKTFKNCQFYLLDIVNRAIKLKRDFCLRATQKLVVMLALMNEKHLLAQVSTGEGKTLIIATLCIIKCLFGEKIDIVTSCSVLAKRDAESEPPKSNIDLYALFNIDVGHICSEDIDQRIEVFQKCDVIYGDLSSFQRDYLLDRFYGKNILGTRTFQNVIVDEVDSMLLDNGNNMLYLSHDIPNMDKLQSLYIFLWQSVNRPIQSVEDLKNFYDNSSIRQSVIADLYGMVMQDEVENDVWKKLTDSKTIDHDGRLLNYQNDYTQLVRTFRLSQTKTESRLIFLLNNINTRQRRINIPKELYQFVERHLDRFIDNAKYALFMSVGVDYVIDVDRTGLDPDLNPKIIIIDKNTGTDQSSSQWHEALHQFLQIKHGCKLSLMSLKAVFTSNVSYLKLYQKLYGLSGTLGSTQEKELLNQLYNVDLVKIPTSKPKKFFEERSIISGYNEQWMENIYRIAKAKLLNGRSVLIIGETVKDVDYIIKRLIKIATESETSESKEQECGTLKNPYVYKREHEEFVFGQGNEYLSGGKVIVATNLAGRGTDIKLDKKLVKAGGLHVILTFLPVNCRVEEQAYGRAARCGEKGSGQLIVIGNEEDGGSFSSKIFQLKNARDVNELQRLKMVQKFYDERITIEENCFKIFKDKYEELRRKIELYEDTKDLTKLVLDSFLDKWAFWLDENSTLIENHTSDSSKKSQLSKLLQQFLEPISVNFVDWLDSPSQFLKLGKHYIKNKEYEIAEQYFKKIIDKDPYYSAEALYYSSAVLIKKNSSILLNKNKPEFKQLKKNLIQAKNLFQERINTCSNDQAMVESFKKQEANILIHIEAFSEQQKTISQIYNLFINSIDDILGHSATYNAFVNYELNEILAYDIFIELQRQSIITQPSSTVIDSNDILTDIAIEYGISEAVLQTYLRDNVVVTSKSIAKVIDLPNVEEFWSLLKKAEILEDELEFIVVNLKQLELIESTRIKNLIKNHKLNISLQKLESDNISQYPIGVEEENSFCSITLYSDLNTYEKCYLEERGICSINRKAKINPKKIQNELDFPKFDSLKLSDITRLKITDDEAIMILETLSQQKVNILEERSNGTYKLKHFSNCSSLPNCYQDVIAALLNSKFAYRLAYVHLKKYYEESKEKTQSDSNLKFQFRLTSNPYQRLIYDLTEKSIVEDSYVIHKKIESADFEKIFNNFQSSFAQHVDYLKKKENCEFIRKSLDRLCCGIDKYETLDCFFSSLEQTIKAQHISAIVEASWFSLNGMEDFIVLQEQAYSWKFWRNVLIVTTLALAQITVGALIEIWTVGVGTYAASFFINEGSHFFLILRLNYCSIWFCFLGVSDLFFVTSCLFHGHMTLSSYWEHKKWSMAISAVSCGIGAIWSRGTKLSRIGYKVAGPVRVEGGKKVAEMAGAELIKSVGMKTVAKETVKRVSCKLLEGAAYGFAQGAVDHVSYLFYSMSKK